MGRNRERGGFQKFILMTLLRGGPMSLKELEEKAAVFVLHFPFQQDRGSGGVIDVAAECLGLVEGGAVRLTDAGGYALTEAGKAEAEDAAREMEKAGRTIESQFLSPTAATRNTAVADFFLAAIKLVAGALSGSVALVADGTDAAIDTASACVVWAGMKAGRELAGAFIIILMMFATAATIGYESAAKVFEAVTASASPVLMPYLVIGVEALALVAASVLHYYQRFVGRRSGSLALISQSVDSKNHIYIAGAVILGAVFSILGLHFVDALIGGAVALKIAVDGFGLAGEALHSMRGEEADLSKYGLPFEKRWQLGKLESFRGWILYSIREGGPRTRGEIVASLEETYAREYLPILSELKLGLGKGYDFEAGFGSLMEPLLGGGLLVQKEDRFVLTDRGRQSVSSLFRSIRHRRST